MARQPQGAAKATAMKRRAWYVVTFYKTVASDYGYERETRQGAFDIVAADRQRALARAKDEFCRSRGLRDWSLHADRYEIERRTAPPAEHPLPWRGVDAGAREAGVIEGSLDPLAPGHRRYAPLAWRP